ncbi:MAG: glycoside hydrolase, partial [Dysgonamonadaceae bacterium]|nr:glycoside hydrolase [Dysgonamonadaceae bacterium]
MNKKITTLLLIALFAGSGYDTLYGQANTNIPNKYVKENTFIGRQPDTTRPPAFDEIKSLLPIPVWDAQPGVIESYWRMWELQFAYLHRVTLQNRFISPYLEPPFNGCIFMWDACFSTLFGRYAHRAFNFQASLDNFYCNQHEDGYICRQLSMTDGSERFKDKFDPSSTGPNLMPWSEWDYFLNLNDTVRLREVFPVLLAYYRWYRTNRTWQDGSYFSSGWGSGMDNQPRLPKGEEFDPRFSTGFLSWIDITLQQVFVGKIMLQMAGVLDRKEDVRDIEAETGQLSAYVQRYMWDDRTAFYYDRYRDGTLNYVKSIAAFWSLPAEVVPPENAGRLIAHLDNPGEFKRVHRVPTLSADHPEYDPDNGYWNGPVWAPTNYMVLEGLTTYGRDSLAHEIALNHVLNVAQVYAQTGTFWENYTADRIGGTAMKNFLDWNGLITVNNLFEYIFGVRANVPGKTLLIDIRLTDEYGIRQYPFGKNGLLDIHCRKRAKVT